MREESTIYERRMSRHFAEFRYNASESDIYLAEIEVPGIPDAPQAEDAN